MSSTRLPLPCVLLAGAAPLLVGFSPRACAATTPSDTLVIGFDAKPKSSDPRLIGTDANSQYLEELRFLGLVGFDVTGSPKMVLAEKIEPHGKLEWKVKLRKGVKFANGREITAEDVVATYQFIIQGAPSFPPSPRKGAYARVKEVKKIGPHEVQFILNGPDAPFVTNLVIGILPKEALAAGPDQLTGKGYESGPFVLEKAADDAWVLAKNANYSAAVVGGKVPSLNKVTFRIITDNNTRYAALVKGDLDLVQNSLDADKVMEIQRSHKDKFNVATRTSTSTTFLGFNFKQPLFQKPQVRLALAKAINRDEILQYTLQGLGEKAAGMFPAGLPFHEKSLAPIEYDPAGAMKLLDEAGLKDPDGKGPQPRARFTIKVPTNKERIAVAKAIAGQLKRVGLDVSIESLEFGTFTKQLSDGIVAAWIAPWTGYKDPDHLNFVFHTKQAPPLGANRGHYSNPKVDALFDKGREEMEMPKRLPHYSEAQKLLAADFPYVYLWFKSANVVMAKNVKGYTLYADGRYVSLSEVTKN